MKHPWHFVGVGLFVFGAILFLTVVIDITAEYKQAQILVEPTFGQLTGQAWDNWRGSVLNLFSFFSF